MNDNNLYDKIITSEDKINDHTLGLNDCANSSGTFLLTNESQGAKIVLHAIKNEKTKIVAGSHPIAPIYDYTKGLAKLPSKTSDIILEAFFINDDTFCIVGNQNPETRQFFKINENKRQTNYVDTLSDEEGMALLQASGKNPFSDGKKFNARALQEQNNLKFQDKHNLSSAYSHLAAMIDNNITRVAQPVEKTADDPFADAVTDDKFELKAGKKLTQLYGLAQNLLKKAANGTIDLTTADLPSLDLACSIYCRDINGNLNPLGKNIVSQLEKHSKNPQQAAKNTENCRNADYQKVGKEIAVQIQQMTNAQTFQR
mgnify:FL=1